MAIETTSPENLHLPFVVTPRFSRRLGEAARTLSFADAVVDTFADSGIHFELEGDTLPPTGGLLIAGDHSQQIEPLLVQAAMSASGRDSASVLAMPISFSGRLMQGSGKSGIDRIIPVIPTFFSDQQKPDLKTLHGIRTAYRKLRYPSAMDQPIEYLRTLNSQSLDIASERITNGEAVTIFPTGGPAKMQWQRGIGEIASRIPVLRRDEAEVVLFKPERFSRKKILGAMAMREAGLRPRSQTVVLRVANAGTIAEVGPSVDMTSREYAEAFTDTAKKAYDTKFM